MLQNHMSPGICPGGVQEVMYMTSDDEVVLYLKKRLGIIKLAMKYGVPIIPTFTFNQRKVFSYWIPRNQTVLQFGRKIGFVPMVFFGLFNIPFGLPKPCPLTVVVGNPIIIPKIAEDELDNNMELMLKIQTELISSMTDLFEVHKERFGMGAVTLKIV